jgi:hypothetical protein
MLYLLDYWAEPVQKCEAYIEGVELNGEIDPMLHLLIFETCVSCGDPATLLKGIILRGS